MGGRFPRHGRCRDDDGDSPRPCGRLRSARDWERYHNPKDLALALLLEAAELAEVFLWTSPEDLQEADPWLRGRIADELADVAIYGLAMANRLSLDLSDAVLAKLDRNESRYPARRSTPPRRVSRRR